MDVLHSNQKTDLNANLQRNFYSHKDILWALNKSLFEMAKPVTP